MYIDASPCTGTSSVLEGAEASNSMTLLMTNTRADDSDGKRGRKNSPVSFALGNKFFRFERRSNLKAHSRTDANRIQIDSVALRRAQPHLPLRMQVTSGPASR